jgi:hypothetical protein
VTWGARIRWVPANVGLGIMTDFTHSGPLVAFIVGPFALFVGKNP